MRITFVLKDGTRRELQAEAGASVMETAIRNNIRGVDAECGGCCSCATCHVYVEEGGAALPEPDEAERDMLEGVAAERLPNSRLGCQIQLTPELDGLVVRVPDTQG